MEKIEKFLSKYIVLIILLLSLPAVWALLVPGYYGASDDLHIAWLFEMDKTIKLGQIPPRFVPDLSYQFGYPLFNFVFPLPFYIGEIFHLVGLNFVDSVKAVFLISVPLSFLFMYKLLKEFTTPVLSLLGATIYVYTPYRATDLYVRGAIGEIVGFIFFPLICWSIYKIYEQKKLSWVIIGGLSIAGLILTHNIAAYMFLPAIFLLGLILLFFSADKIATAIRFLLTFILAGLISLYFWLPAILDSKLMKYDTVFNFIDHFPTLKQLVVPYWGYGASVPGPYDGMSFFLGGFNLLLVFAGLVVILWNWKKIDLNQKIIITWGYLVFIIAILLMNYRSSFLWERIPNLAYFQFPWRFLMLTTFITPIFIITWEKIKFTPTWVYLLLVGLVIGTNTFQFRPQDFLGRKDQYYLNRYIPFPQASNEYRQTQEEYLRLPKETLVRPNDIYPTVFSDQKFNAQVKKINDLNSQLTITSDQGLNLNYSKYNFPGWQALLDGKNLDIQSGPPFGQISVKIPPGTHQVAFYFKETSTKLVLDFISLISLVVALILIFNQQVQNWRKKYV